MPTWTTGFTNYLAPGVSVTFAFTWPAGQDPGAQAFLARPKPPSSTWYPRQQPVRYEVTTETVRAAVQLGYVPNWSGSGGWGYGGYGVPSPSHQPQWTYLATVRNTGQVGVWCELIGGKVQ